MKKYSINLCTLIIAFTIISCKDDPVKLSLSDFPTDTIMVENENLLDSFKIINVFRYKDYVIGIVPHSSFGKYPYVLYNSGDLTYNGVVGQFGRSYKEFTEVNPYYIIKNDTSFIQCTDGYFESSCVITEGNLNILWKNKLSSFNMNNLCRIDSNRFCFLNEDIKNEFILYSSTTKDYSKFSNFPDDYFPCKEYDEYLGFYDKTTSYNDSDSLLYSFYANIPMLRIYDNNGIEQSSFIIETNIDNSQFYQDYINECDKEYYSMAKSTGKYIFALYHGESFSIPYSEIHVWGNRGKLIKRIILNKWIKCFDIDIDAHKVYGIYVDEDEHLFSASFYI